MMTAMPNGRTNGSGGYSNNCVSKVDHSANAATVTERVGDAAINKY